MYNGIENLGFLSINNDIKTFTSKSGHTLLFFDGKNPSISLTDKNQNIIHINTNDNSISISSNNKIFISSDNIELTARENLILGGKHVSISAGNDMTLISRKTTTYTDEAIIDCDSLNVKANNDIVMESTEDTILKNDKTIIINKNFKNVSDENAEMDAKKEINLNTKEINLTAKKIKHKK